MEIKEDETETQAVPVQHKVHFQGRKKTLWVGWVS